jgi:predicted nucleotidyltransferase
MSFERYQDVLIALADSTIQFVVTGGVAVALHGLERKVQDLDIVANPAADNLNSLMACLSGLGFVSTLPLPISAVVVLRTIDITGREVDINRLYRVPFRDLEARAIEVSIHGRNISVIGRDDLIAVKEARGRHYDMLDIQLLRGL